MEILPENRLFGIFFVQNRRKMGPWAPGSPNPLLWVAGKNGNPHRKSTCWHFFVQNRRKMGPCGRRAGGKEGHSPPPLGAPKGLLGGQFCSISDQKMPKSRFSGRVSIFFRDPSQWIWGPRGPRGPRGPQGAHGGPKGPPQGPKGPLGAPQGAQGAPWGPRAPLGPLGPPAGGCP